MKIFADLHIHSRFARATSSSINIPNLQKAAKLKGVNLLGTGDFTHPIWFKEMKKDLRGGENGVYTYADMNFILQTEVSLIYSQGDKLRKVHNIILAPSFEVVAQINEFLGTRGKLASDGRPIFGKLSTIELIEKLMGISKDIMVIPAHVWTPWFSIFGSMSGFDTVKEALGDQINHVHAMETGLSSDPPMNWRLSQLDRFTLISNSDAHSANVLRLGRELNVFETDKMTYKEICDIIKKADKRFLYTMEVDPSYGKYHFDGHRNCSVRMDPAKSIKHKNLCPKCGRKLTIGVLHRVEELADRKDGYVPKGKPGFKRMLPLAELISSIRGVQVFTKTVMTELHMLINEFGSELNVLLEAPKEKIAMASDQKLADVIMLNREGKVRVDPGYDGVYGKAIFSKGSQAGLNRFL